MSKIFWIKILLHLLKINSNVIFLDFLLSVDTHDDGWDVSKLREEDFDKLATYFVPDRPCSENTNNRAEASLPRNLQLRPSQTLKDVSKLDHV